MRKYLAIIAIICIASCNKDIEKVTVKGWVKDVGTNEPIKNIDVTVICWKYGNSPDGSYSENEIKVVTTDDKGQYKVSFNKSAFLEIKTSLEGYIDTHQTKELYEENNTINISLVKDE
ncbi:hypothetical protein [Fulvivirga ligni]|uniref:hypothetical protein n=1 Tax=Fulvivirga ligni TaxID=2904246 RepID=UPI001F3C82FF|nr:hypothetical protein [Fulvivirga ligni]UII21597.1 hypothetical protein LVD16_27600 [Fulvivirga ligni]UII21646.1 hypothetical protein LVD16_00135 [Fulvivirga ligni]